jgi:CRP-like cAMP-binding protein
MNRFGYPNQSVMIDIDLLLTWGATYKKLSPGEIIFKEGDKCQFYFQLVSGKVSWVNVDENGKEFIQAIISPGEPFGELPLFDDEPYAASAIANEPSLIIRLCKSTFLQLLKQDPAIHLNITRLLCKKTRFKFLLIKTLANQVPETRINALLQYLRKEHKHICPNCNQLMLTRQEIADMTGLRVETVIRSIRHMHDKGELTIEKGKVYC